MRQLWAAALFLFLLAAPAFAETPDAHLASARTSAIVRQSTFLHGYLHGYEEGYSAGDIDLQMARGARDPSKMKEAHTAVGYRSEFGPRPSFERGYNQGFRVGYADSIASRAFRAIDLIQHVMELPIDPAVLAQAPVPVKPPQPRVPIASALLDVILPHPALNAALPPQPRAQPAAPAPISFDQAFADGYSLGQRRGLVDGRSAVPMAATSTTCPASISAEAQRLEFCTAYVRGFAMGYSDGYVNVSHAAAKSASSAQSK